MRLRERRLISVDDAQRIADPEAFGRLIGNTDMHYGNLSFFRQDPPAKAFFRLAPVYDQLPMLYAPVAGEIVERHLENTVLAPSAEALANMGRTSSLRPGFGLEFRGDTRVSKRFRKLASENGDVVSGRVGRRGP